LPVDVCSNLYDFEFDGRDENLENVELSGSRIGNWNQLVAKIGVK